MDSILTLLTVTVVIKKALLDEMLAFLNTSKL